MEDEFAALGAELIWVMEQTAFIAPGTAENCRTQMDEFGSSSGWCVGDDQTQPTPGSFDDSPFSIGRGFDMIVDRDTMEVLWISNHGTPAGNENLTGADVLAAVEDAVGG